MAGRGEWDRSQRPMRNQPLPTAPGTTHRNESNPNIEIVPASREQEPVLANLLELYIHDFTDFLHRDIGADGRFDYDHLPLYWSDPDRHPFLIRTDGRLSGFVLVTRGPDISDRETVWDMSEYFVLRGYRRLGIGTRAAHAVWMQRPGRWQIRVMESNVPAQHFWSRAIAAFTGKPVIPTPFENCGSRWLVFSFASNPTA